MAMQNEETKQVLWSGAHHWHFQAASESSLSFICCSCDCTIMVEANDHGFLCYSLMRGSELIGIGRGFMTGDCPAGQRRIELDGYEEGCSRTGCIGRQERGLVELVA